MAVQVMNYSLGPIYFTAVTNILKQLFLLYIVGISSVRICR